MRRPRDTQTAVGKACRACRGPAAYAGSLDGGLRYRYSPDPMTSIRLGTFALLGLAACVTGTATRPSPGDLPIALVGDTALPREWHASRPPLPAALVEPVQDGFRFYLLIEGACEPTVHAHARLRSDSLAILVHWGSTHRARALDPYNCFTECDFSCPILFVGTIPVRHGRYVVLATLADSLLTQVTLTTGPDGGLP